MIRQLSKLSSIKATMCKIFNFLTLATPVVALKKTLYRHNCSPLHQGFALEPGVTKMNGLKAVHRLHQFSPGVSHFSKNFMASKKFKGCYIQLLHIVVIFCYSTNWLIVSAQLLKRPCRQIATWYMYGLCIHFNKTEQYTSWSKLKNPHVVWDISVKLCSWYVIL